MRFCLSNLYHQSIELHQFGIPLHPRTTDPILIVPLALIRMNANARATLINMTGILEVQPRPTCLLEHVLIDSPAERHSSA